MNASSDISSITSRYSANPLRVRRAVEQRRLQGGRDQRLQVAPADVGIGVLAGDHLALLGDADLSRHAAWRLRQDGLIARSAAAAHRAAAAVEQAQLDAVPLEDLDQLDLGLVQLPVRSEVAAVLVAVRIAEHDLLHIAAALEHARYSVIANSSSMMAPQPRRSAMVSNSGMMFMCQARRRAAAASSPPP